MKKTQAVRAVAASQHPREVEDAIAYLHSMLSLAEARGWTIQAERGEHVETATDTAA